MNAPTPIADMPKLSDANRVAGLVSAIELAAALVSVRHLMCLNESVRSVALVLLAVSTGITTFASTKVCIPKASLLT